MNIFQLYHLLISGTANVLLMGEERLIYKVDSSYPISSLLLSLSFYFGRHFGERNLYHDPSSLKPAPLSFFGFRDTRVPEMSPVPSERATSPLPSFKGHLSGAAMLYIM